MTQKATVEPVQYATLQYAESNQQCPKCLVPTIVLAEKTRES